jgi:D-amino peptidase
VLGDHLPTYAVKDGIDMFSALCLHPDVTSVGIREGVANALRDISARKAYTMDGELTFGFEYSTTTMASTCEYIPGVKKVTPRSTEFTTADMPEAMRIIFAQLLLALQVGQKAIYS